MTDFGLVHEPARPARTIGRLAAVTQGGTGRYNLVVGAANIGNDITDDIDTDPAQHPVHVVFRGLSKFAAHNAAEAINEAFQSWVDQLAGSASNDRP